MPAIGRTARQGLWPARNGPKARRICAALKRSSSARERSIFDWIRVLVEVEAWLNGESQYYQLRRYMVHGLGAPTSLVRLSSVPTGEGRHAVRRNGMCFLRGSRGLFHS
jgi:hypothetical protein